jgi:dienelactone hydrolase
MHIVLFHSALGLTAPVTAFADALREDGHHVDTPDLFAGRTFETTALGTAHRDALGIEVLMERAFQAVAKLPTSLVYAGFSMGAAAATALSVMRPGARGALLMHGAIPLAMLGVTAWPAIPVQLHTSPRDPFVNDDDVGAFVADVRASRGHLTHHLYPETSHLFSHETHHASDARARTLLRERARAFVRTLEREESGKAPLADASSVTTSSSTA